MLTAATRPGARQEGRRCPTAHPLFNLATRERLNQGTTQAGRRQTAHTAVCLYTTSGRVKAAHPLTTVARPLFALVLLLEGTGGGILVLPKGEHAGRFLLWLEEEEDDGGGEETEAETVLAEVEETVLALEEETVLEVVEEEETVFGVEEDVVLVLEEEE
ncbi:hypothetical protein E2C01_041555 [Portunus trituberculatus]|uniref:Uncharacterized protein n=1 Tax=Portunus trituberculatus TaxID=210409 RepID=A0A5B7FS67_PORTR|nr:hypothetical protein [Portunus trituberculatus]